MLTYARRLRTVQVSLPRGEKRREISVLHPVGL